MAKRIEKAADDTDLLDWRPSLKDLRNIVVLRVSSKWKTVGLNLEIEDCRLSAIEESQHYQTDACCTEMFSSWLSLAPHTGSLPLTWRSVLSAIEKVERATSEELLDELKRTVEAPRPLPQEPTHQVIQMLAGELKAYYNRLESVVRDAYAPELEFLELAMVNGEKHGLRKRKKLEEFLHATVHGIDEIYEVSHPVEYCQILTLERAPSTGKHIIISGAPGSGKTTLVQQLCKDLSSGDLPNDYTVVVLVELRELILFLQNKEEPPKLHHFLSNFKHKIDVNLACQELEKSDGRGTLLVLDGFDELDVKMRKCELLRNLLATKSNYLPDCDILVTTRPVTCPDLLCLMQQPPHRHIEVLGFAEDRIASYVQSYFKPTSEPSLHVRSPPTQPPPQAPHSRPVSPQMLGENDCEARKLLSRLDQLPHIKGMCRTPVVLKIVCRVCELLGGADFLPETMTGIYEEFILRQLLENGPKGAETSSILHVPPSDYPFFSDLCRIAFECCTDQKLIISKQDIGDTHPPLIRGSIYGLLQTYPVEDVRALRELVLYHFMHKTVQEALAACHVAMLPNSESHLKVWKKWFGRPEMAEVWKFYCGLTELAYLDISVIAQLAYEAKMNPILHFMEQLPEELAQLTRSQEQQDAHVHVLNLLVVSLFEANSASLAQVALPHFFRSQLCVSLSTPYKTAANAFALQHHTSLESLDLSWTAATGSDVNLQPLIDALSCHRTVRAFHISNKSMVKITAKDRQVLCQFFGEEHRLTCVKLHTMPEEVLVAALSSTSSTMEELECIQFYASENRVSPVLTDSLRNTTLKRITIEGSVGDMVLPILNALAANTSTVHRTVRCLALVTLSPPSMSEVSELRQFLVPCVSCNLSVLLPVEVWATVLGGVGTASLLERLRVHVQNLYTWPDEASPEWNRIDQTTLEELEKSWAHSRCREAVFDISTTSKVFVGLALCTAPMQGSQLDAITKLLCAVVKGIIQRKDSFVLELQVSDEQISLLEEVNEIAQNRCAVAAKRKNCEDGTVFALQLKPHHVAQ